MCKKGFWPKWNAYLIYLLGGKRKGHRRFTGATVPERKTGRFEQTNRYILANQRTPTKGGREKKIQKRKSKIEMASEAQRVLPFNARRE